MSLETRSNSALFKRAEQLRRWEESETNRETPVPKNKNRKIQFSAGCVFLAACAAGDKEEVLRLIQMGADIDTANVDGLTALHQACIDDNLDMVEFLVEHGADINRGDNEGWTPLHATASCGFISIAKYLIEHGGNVAAVNNDGELPVDIAESDEMEEMLQQYINSQGIDCDEARNEEERIMLEDAKEWLNSGDLEDIPHPKTGATALHVAAAKGYIKVMSVQLQGGADVNAQDFDGWTPLHAAAHWGQKEACEMLVENFCDMDMKNYVGQTAFDVADTEMFRFLEELKKKQAALQRDRGDINILQKKGTNHAKRGSSITRMSVNDKSNLINKDASLDRQLLDQSINEEGNNKVKKVELEIETEPEREESTIPLADKEVEKKNKANRDEPSRFPAVPEVKSVPNAASGSPPKSIGEAEDSIGEWRHPGSFRTRVAEQAKPLTLRIGEKATTPPGPETRNNVEAPEVVLRRTQSFESDEKRAPREDLKINSNALSTTTATVTTTVATTTTTTATSPTATSPLPTSQVRSVSTPSTPTTPGGSKLSPGNIFKNFFKSFVPPVRDEESETQRKAHAKRVRETRRSTQGVTLEEIKSAEQLVKKKNQQQLHQATQQLSNNDQPSVIIPTTSSTSITATITTATPTVPSSGVTKEEVAVSQDRRPSWRLRVDNGDRSKFMLEDVRSKSGPSESTAAYIRRPVGSASTPVRPSSAPVETSTPDTSVTLALRRQTKPPDDKDQDKENDIRNAQATQAVIQRRRRPKRRSTGVVMPDEVDPDRQESPGREGDDYSKMNNEESGGELSGHSSRLSSVSGGSGDASVSNSNSRSGTPAHSAKDGGENGELDYKKLYEQSLAENDRLREKLKKTEDDLHEAKTQIEKLSVANVKNSSEMEKRERRAMERKLSEMEEELKQLQKLKAENERLKAENRALTRVVSKLTNSAHATK